jgi:signal transduction histidine kinase
MEVVGPQAEAHELKLRVAPELPRVMGDPARLVQVLTNLVGNALKFTPAGGRILVGAEPLGEGVTFFVSDNGPGISPQELPHLFEPFWQRDVTDRRGLGLGLTICQGIVEAHGSRLQVESEPGRGTTFSFSLAPARKAGSPGRGHAKEGAAPSEHGAP